MKNNSFSWLRQDLLSFLDSISVDADQFYSSSVPNFHLAFVGSGLSSTFTLIESISQLNKTTVSHSFHYSCVNIVVFEKHICPWGGIPYGIRSGFNSLIITPLDEFLPQSELSLFCEWLSHNIDWLILPFKENAGERSKAWLRDNQVFLESKNYLSLHIPRYFFGVYLLDKLRTSLISSSIRINLSFVQSEVTSISKDDIMSSFQLVFDVDKVVNSSKVLLGIGIPPVRRLNTSLDDQSDLLFIHDPYQISLSQTLSLITKHFLARKASNVLIVGANASSLEILYQLTNLSFPLPFQPSFTVMSPQGSLPSLYIKDKPSDFRAISLEDLEQSHHSITADAILESFKKDLEFANAKKYDISDTLPVFTRHVGSLIQRLSLIEKYKFITFHGHEIGRLQRRAGREYSIPPGDLRASGRLDVIKGLFTGLTNKNGKGLVSYNHDGKTFTSSDFDVVVNCSGSAGLKSDIASPLLKQLTDSGLCKPTESNLGLKVGNSFQVTDGFFVNGPLLSGNIVGEMGIWHVEHCGRIISFAKQIASHLISEFR